MLNCHRITCLYFQWSFVSLVSRHPDRPCIDQRLSERDATSPSFLQNLPLQIWSHPIHHHLAITFNGLDHLPTPVHQRLLPLCDLKHGPVGCRCRIVLANKCLSKLCTQWKRKKEKQEKDSYLWCCHVDSIGWSVNFLGLWVEDLFRRVSQHLIFRWDGISCRTYILNPSIPAFRGRRRNQNI